MDLTRVPVASLDDETHHLLGLVDEPGGDGLLVLLVGDGLPLEPHAGGHAGLPVGEAVDVGVRVGAMGLGVDDDGRRIIEDDESGEVHGLLLWGAEIVRLHALVDDK